MLREMLCIGLYSSSVPVQCVPGVQACAICNTIYGKTFIQTYLFRV